MLLWSFLVWFQIHFLNLKQKTLKNSLGFGLIELMVALTLLGTLGMLTLRTIESLNRARKVAGFSGQVSGLRLQLLSLLSKRESCVLSLRDASGGLAYFNPDQPLLANPTSAEFLAYKAVNTLSKIALPNLSLASENETSGDVKILSVRLVELDPKLRTQLSVAGSPVRRIASALRVNTSATVGALEKLIEVPILVDIDSANKIVGCSTTDTGEGVAPGTSTPASNTGTKVAVIPIQCLSIIKSAPATTYNSNTAKNKVVIALGQASPTEVSSAQCKLGIQGNANGSQSAPFDLNRPVYVSWGIIGGKIGQTYANIKWSPQIMAYYDPASGHLTAWIRDPDDGSHDAGVPAGSDISFIVTAIQP